jgi:ABC-2 type transport system ATP-binding protein
MIRAEHLAKRYGNTVALDDISFEVEAGKVTGFLGPNGAGKSTTMRLMLGLDRGEGTTTYDGKALRDYRRPLHVVGMLLEARAFHPTRTARSHLRVLATAGAIPAARVDEALDAVGLLQVGDRRPGKFSMGMGQRLGIAAAILGEPRYLILDEPANGLDPEGMHWLRGFLRAYAAKDNAVFISSHLLAELAQMVDNVVVIGRGRLMARSSMRELIACRSPGGVFARTDQTQQFENLLARDHLVYERVGDGFTIAGVTTDEISRLAFEARIPLLELASRAGSLEDVFLELTEGAEEYRSGSSTKR